MKATNEKKDISICIIIWVRIWLKYRRIYHRFLLDKSIKVLTRTRLLALKNPAVNDIRRLRLRNRFVRWIFCGRKSEWQFNGKRASIPDWYVNLVFLFFFIILRVFQSRLIAKEIDYSLTIVDYQSHSSIRFQLLNRSKS